MLIGVPQEIKSQEYHIGITPAGVREAVQNGHQIMIDENFRGVSMTGTLEQRPFGRTGETVSLIGLGGAALHKHSYQHGLATVKHALDLGISYFDTSPVYGIMADGKWISEGEAQHIMGEGLEGTSKPHLLATKISAWQTYNYSVEDCLAQVRDNLRVLRRDRVDVLLGHNMEFRRFWKPEARDPNIPPNGGNCWI